MAQPNSKLKQTETIKKKQEKKTSSFFLESRFILPAIVLITAIVYFNSIKNDFVLNWDDENYIMKNPLIQDFSFNMIKEVFSNFLKGGYFPITTIGFAFQYHFFGANPHAFHFFNLFIHLLSVVVVFFFTKKIFTRSDAAIIVALLFGIHPMQVESVAWIAELKNVLYGLFYMLSLFYYLKYLDNIKKYKYLIFSFLFFLLSDLSKAAATTIPVILLLIDFYYKRKFSIKTILEKVPFFLLAFILGIVAIYAQKEANALQNLSESFSVFDRLLFTSYQLVIYFVKLFLPVNLSAFYYYPASSAEMGWEFYISPFVVLIIGYGIYKIKNRRREVIFGFLFFLIGISVMLQIIAFGGAILAERFVYIPYIGLFIIIAQLYCSIADNKIIFSNKLKTPIIFIFLIYFFFLAFVTYSRIPKWENAVVLFSDVIEKNPTGDFGYQYRGVARALNGDFKGCIEDQSKAIDINPKYAEAFYSRGLAKMSLKDYKNSFEDFTKAINIKQEYPDAYNNMGNIMLKFKQFEKALNYYDLVLKYDVKHSLAYYNKGACYYYMNKLDKACEFWQIASEMGYSKAIEMKKKFCK